MSNKRIFISFAIENKLLRDFLIGQKNNIKSPIEFYDYSVKEPWSNSWKTKCRTRIRGCSGVIGLITKNTPSADGQLWELKCAYDENIPVLLIHGKQDERMVITPSEIKGRQINTWTWDRISNFVAGL